MSATKTAAEDDFDSDIIKNIPDLGIAQLFFTFTKAEANAKADHFTRLLDRIKENEMGPYYEYVCEESGVKVDKNLLQSLKEKNAKRLEEIDNEIKDAKDNLGESEVRKASLRKTEYLCQIGDKTAAAAAAEDTFEKTVGIGYRIDLIFNLIRLGFFFLDHKLITDNIQRAKTLMEQGGDWDRKNRLRCYEGFYRMAVRDFKAAAQLFLEVVPTFGAVELMTYESLIFYTVITTIYALERPDLYSKVVRCNEIQEQLIGGGTNGELVSMREYLEAFYECKYDQFYTLLAQLEVDRLKTDRYLEPHNQFYSRAMRLRAYTQFLAPYKTVRLALMAKEFGVSKQFIDKELHAQVSAGLLNCRIDAVNEIVHITHTDSRNELYKAIVTDGDTLFNRVQMLARLVN